MRSARRGGRCDPISSRPYHPGDDLRRIDRHASARLSAVRGETELIVREHLAEEAPRVAVLADPAPTMRLYPSPWLSKPEAVDRAAALIEASAYRERCRCERRDSTAGLAAGSFTFLLSDFLTPPPEEFWLEALARRLDPVPVVIQDPVWEQSFPDAAGTVLPVAGPEGGRVRLVRLSRKEASERRRLNEERFERLLEGFASLALEPVVLGSADDGEILEAFLSWADGRRRAA